MSDNPYFSWSREDLKEEIRVEKEQREELRNAISRLRDEIRNIRPLTRGYYVFNGEPISTEAYNLARTTAYLSGSRFNTSLRQLNNLVDSPGPLLYAVRYEPYKIQTVESILEERPEKALREAEIKEYEERIDVIDAELRKKDEAWKRPVTPPYMLIEFVKFWEIKDESVKNRKRTPKIRFEVRSTWTVPWSSIEAERRNKRWVPTIIDDKVINYADEVLWDVIDQWGGAEIDFRYYSESVVGIEEKGTATSFNGLPDFTITKYKDGNQVATWPWRRRISEDRM